MKEGFLAFKISIIFIGLYVYSSRQAELYVAGLKHLDPATICYIEINKILLNNQTKVYYAVFIRKYIVI